MAGWLWLPLQQAQDFSQIGAHFAAEFGHMRLHTEMPSVALLRGSHLWIALVLLVLGCGGTSDNAKNASYSAALRPHGGTAPAKSKSFDICQGRGGESPAHPIAASVMRRITISTSRTADSTLMPYSSSKARRV